MKIACLRIDDNGTPGVPPKDANLGRAVRFMFDSGTSNADSVEADLDSTLLFLENNGVPTRDFLPRIPPVYVIAALQPDLESIHETRRAQAISLITKYLWWSFLSNRYENQANDRLHRDYQGLRAELQHLEASGETQSTAPIFQESQLVTRDRLAGSRNVFRTKTPLGRAITALTIDAGARDWVTGEQLTSSTVRDLEDRDLEETSQLDRHHVYPRKALTSGAGSLNRNNSLIGHGVNIVLLRKKANITLGGKEPTLYLERLQQDDPTLTDEELRSRIESHKSPYDILRSQGGTVRERYTEYLNRRADMLLQAIEERCLT